MYPQTHCLQLVNFLGSDCGGGGRVGDGSGGDGNSGSGGGCGWL